MYVTIKAFAHSHWLAAFLRVSHSSSHSHFPESRVVAFFREKGENLKCSSAKLCQRYAMIDIKGFCFTSHTHVNSIKFQRIFPFILALVAAYAMMPPYVVVLRPYCGRICCWRHYLFKTSLFSPSNCVCQNSISQINFEKIQLAGRTTKHPENTAQASKGWRKQRFFHTSS